MKTTKPPKKLKDRVALVTGAGSGIGRATALALADAGAALVLCDIDEERLEAVRQEVAARSRVVHAAMVDVSDREAMAAFAEAVHERVPAVDVLVNNAGIAVKGALLETPLDEWDRVFAINLHGVVHGCHFFCPKMVERGEGGHVVNVASGVGLFAPPGLAAYSSSKFAVVGLSESLRGELRPHGIGVTTICPGLIQTNIVEATRCPGAADERLAQASVKRITDRWGHSPDYVARAILRAIGTRRGVVPVTLPAHLFYYLKRLSPDLTGWLSRKLIPLFDEGPEKQGAAACATT